MRAPRPCSVASQPITFDTVPKPDGSLRIVTLLGDADRRRFDDVVAAILPTIEPALGPGVLANRACRGATAFTLEPFVAARRRYERAITSITRTGPFRAVFLGDVRDCFGSIGAPVVDRSLRRLGASDEAVDRVLEVLRSFQSRGVRGLPIGPDASAIIANAVLAPVDRALAEAARGPVLRWVDDVVVFAADAGGARTAEATFERELGILGLRPHPGKAAVVDDHTAFPFTAAASLAPGTAHGMMRPP